jgi:hypothetical protein
MGNNCSGVFATGPKTQELTADEMRINADERIYG